MDVCNRRPKWRRNCLNVLLKIIVKSMSAEFRIKKVNKRKYDKLYVKWKRYDNSFNN